VLWRYGAQEKCAQYHWVAVCGPHDRDALDDVVARHRKERLHDTRCGEYLRLGRIPGLCPSHGGLRREAAVGVFALLRVRVAPARVSHPCALALGWRVAE